MHDMAPESAPFMAHRDQLGGSTITSGCSRCSSPVLPATGGYSGSLRWHARSMLGTCGSPRQPLSVAPGCTRAIDIGGHGLALRGIASGAGQRTLETTDPDRAPTITQ